MIPGGAIAVVLAALYDMKVGRIPNLEPTLSLIITLNDADREAARFTRHLLDLMGRSDVDVVADVSGPLSGPRPIDGLTPPDIPAQSADVASAVRKLTSKNPYLMRWGNHGRLAVLADALAADQSLANRLSVAVSAGPIPGRDEVVPGPPPFANDTKAAKAALPLLRRPSMDLRDPRTAMRKIPLPSLITAAPAPLALSAASPLQRLLRQVDAPRWAGLLGMHMDRWFAAGNRTSSQYASLTVAEVNGVYMIDSDRERVGVDAEGWLRLDPNGPEMTVTFDVGHGRVDFLEWLERQFREAISSWPRGSTANT